MMPEKQQQKILFNLATMSSQVYHIEEMILQLNKEDRIIELHIRSIAHLMAVGALTVTEGRKQLNPAETKTTALVNRLFSDLRELLKMPQVMKAFLADRDLLRMYLHDVLLLLQGCSSHKRAVTTHVEFESDEWLNAWNSDLVSTFLLPLVANSIVKDVPLMATELPISVKETIDLIGKELVTAEMQMAYAKPDFRFLVKDLNVSFHIPLHRLFALTAAELARADEKMSMKQFLRSLSCLGTNDEEMQSKMMLLIEAPTHIQVMISQIHAGLWRRNGEQTMGSLLNIYKTPYWCLQSHMDIVIAQIAAAVCSPEKVVAFALQRFDATALFQFCPKGKPDPAELIAADDLVRFIAMVCCNRTHAGFEDRLRRQCVQLLALKGKMRERKKTQKMKHRRGVRDFHLPHCLFSLSLSQI